MLAAGTAYSIVMAGDLIHELADVGLLMKVCRTSTMPYINYLGELEQNFDEIYPAKIRLLNISNL